MAAPVPRRIKKGELLFNEGDVSKSMYFVQAGTLRLFKKKGSSSIELGLIHKGEVIGEMGFLDGGPRSASAEAMHDLELVEITNANLVEQMKILPPWLMVLLKTVVNRLRSANNKIRQLETSSTAYTYGAEGVSTTYQFLSTIDVLKILTAALLAASRNGEVTPDGGTKCTMSRIERYANQIMGVHVSKITEMFDIMQRVGLLKLAGDSHDKVEITFMDVSQVETLLNFINDDNLKEHTKKSNFSSKAVMIMSFIVKHIDLFPPGAEGVSEVNLIKIIDAEKASNEGREPFRVDDTFQELVKGGVCTETTMKDSSSISTKINIKNLVRIYRIQRLIKEVEIVNMKKREQAHSGGR